MLASSPFFSFLREAVLFLYYRSKAKIPLMFSISVSRGLDATEETSFADDCNG